MNRLLGWSVHLFTAAGSVCGLLATLAVFQGRYERAFGWLFLALVIDAIDGTLARAVDIEATLPRFSGERLDLVIDYITYVFVPVLAMLHAGLLAGLAGEITAFLILVSSLYHFCDLASKADDKCFVGFPAVWNLVAFCLMAWATPPWLAIPACLALVGLTFVPMHWIHPMRVRRLFWLNIAVMTCGLGAAISVLLTGFPASFLASVILAGAALYFVGMAATWPRGSASAA